MSRWLASAIGAMALGVVAMPAAQASPAGALTGGGAAQQADASAVEQVRHRCYRHRGHWHCPRHRHRHNHIYGYYGYSPYYYGPGINLYFGGGGRHHHHRRHRH